LSSGLKQLKKRKKLGTEYTWHTSNGGSGQTQLMTTINGTLNGTKKDLGKLTLKDNIYL